MEKHRFTTRFIGDMNRINDENYIAVRVSPSAAKTQWIEWMAKRRKHGNGKGESIDDNFQQGQNRLLCYYRLSLCLLHCSSLSFNFALVPVDWVFFWSSFSRSFSPFFKTNFQFGWRFLYHLLDNNLLCSFCLRFAMTLCPLLSNENIWMTCRIN